MLERIQAHLATQSVHPESLRGLQTLSLEVLRPKVADEALFADGLYERAHDLAAILKPTRTDLASVQLVPLLSGEAVADLLDPWTGVR